MKAAKKKSYHSPIFIEQDEDGFYIVSCPSFKGCHSYGKTVEKAMTNIREVIAMCLEQDRAERLHYLTG
jgi:predicted RNase H-like HicB family nuclease